MALGALRSFDKSSKDNLTAANYQLCEEGDDSFISVLSAVALVLPCTKYKNELQNKYSCCQEPVMFSYLNGM